MRLCFIVDVSIAWIAAPLERRGFLVFKPHRDYHPHARDEEICEWARRTGCVVVTKDSGFKWMECPVVRVSHREEYRRNGWELVTRVIKQAATVRRIAPF